MTSALRILAALAAIASVPLGALAVGNLPVGCIEEDGPVARVIAGPFAQGTGWAPACVVVVDGGAVEWVMADPVAHSVLVNGCVESDILFPGSTTAAFFALGAEGGLRGRSAAGDFADCSPFDLDGNPALRAIDGGVEITYICGVHPLSMIGKIQVMEAG